MTPALAPDSDLASARSGLAASVEPVSQVDLAEFSRDLFHGIRWLHKRHGPIAAVEDGGQRVVFLFSPEFNQEVLSDTERFHARFFAVRGPKQSAQRRLTCGLLAMNGEQHRRNRRIVKEPFGLRAIAGYGETIARLTDELLSSWTPGEVRDIAEEMRQYMLRVTSTLLFGLNDAELAYRLGDMIARWVALNQDVGAGALVPNDRFFHHYEDLLKFAEELEAEILGMIRRRRENKKPVGDVLSLLVQMHDEEGGLSDEELVGQTAVLFGAAHMTTAHSLTWTLLLLAQHPSVMGQLWEEMNEATAGNGDGPARCPMARDVKALGNLPKGEELSLLDRVIKESMRILPASAYSQRINNVAVKLGPLFLPRGTGIVFTPLVTHHLPEIYAEPEKFLPDRWLSLRPSPYAYHPFGAGPRLCIGGPLATAIIRIALQQILLRYRLSIVPGSDIGVHVESTMLVPTNGLPMRIHEADGRFSSVPITGRICELVKFYEAPFAAGERSENETGDFFAPPRRPK
ncbi:MAG TPA: cytochrome P450 [Lacipirellulaceae bacterium]|nr:cytochrome P450 [Lacipirellulaceae bacterium]